MSLSWWAAAAAAVGPRWCRLPPSLSLRSWAPRRSPPSKNSSSRDRQAHGRPRLPLRLQRGNLAENQSDRRQFPARPVGLRLLTRRHRRPYRFGCRHLRRDTSPLPRPAAPRMSRFPLSYRIGSHPDSEPGHPCLYARRPARGTPPIRRSFFSGSDSTLNPLSITATTNNELDQDCGGQLGLRDGWRGSDRLDHGQLYRLHQRHPGRRRQQSPQCSRGSGGQRRRQRRQRQPHLLAVLHLILIGQRCYAERADLDGQRHVYDHVCRNASAMSVVRRELVDCDSALRCHECEPLGFRQPGRPGHGHLFRKHFLQCQRRPFKTSRSH